ncbi:hypothetical protein NEF87_000048 [Candidatus Lokiarchaeum ossiferum]|uniref:Uncharacterized protein n=1 Tax=Candidatus Lokiarchaeum ossiferum TaxID=2951803 RepID=A0ABY6HJR5_9ARCH|nr:hypothetical protein NEF87_000048 [Candidatus Lokiarchaeum sp. B-35]
MKYQKLLSNEVIVEIFMVKWAKIRGNNPKYIKGKKYQKFY